MEFGVGARRDLRLGDGSGGGGGGGRALSVVER